MKFILIISITIFIFQKASFAYRAAVVEYHPLTFNSPEKTIGENLKKYHSFVIEAKNQSADIIIFPEYSLTTLVDEPTKYSIDIDQNPHPTIQKLKTIAKENQIYLVVNFLEKAIGKISTKYYNTNLVFDRNGQIIAKYRKINLFAEPNLTRGSQNQNAVFTTDFGVTFGIFTCFDILYQNPSQTILKNNITDIIFSTAWFSTMTFYTSLAVQHGYSLANRVNLLASNYGEPQKTHGGSGIYLKNGQIAEIFISGVAKSRIIVQDVPKKTNTPPKVTSTEMSKYQTFRDFQAEKYKFQNVDLSRDVSKEVCDGEFCCTFDIVTDRCLNSEDIYKLMVYDGLTIFDQSQAHIRVCGLVVCENDSNDSCGIRIGSRTKFSKITVKGSLAMDQTTFYRPMTLDSSLRPLFSEYSSSVNKNSTYVQLTTTKTVENVLIFGIFGHTDSLD